MLLVEMTKFDFEQAFISTILDCERPFDDADAQLRAYRQACESYRLFVAMTFEAMMPAKPQDTEKRRYTHDQIMRVIEALGWQSQQLQIAF